MTQHYKIKRRVGPNTSNSNGGSTFWTIIFTGVDDGLTYKTHIDVSMENFPNWEKIIFSDETMILGNLRLKNKAQGIINADSIPKIIEVVKTSPPPKYCPPADNNFSNLFD